VIRRLLFVLLAFSVSFAAYADGYTKPKVRAITAFVRLDRASYGEQIAAALQVLREAQGDFQKQGYEVQTIRIVTQPLPELVDSLSETQALAFLKNLDDASARENFVPNVGPVMSRDTDDPRNVRLMEKALSTLPHLATSTIIAGEDGIHWKVIAESAALVHYVTGTAPTARAISTSRPPRW